MKKEINLVLSGSGILYPIHAGVIIGLLNNGYSIKKITGVSGGAIIAAMYASGINTPYLIRKYMANLLPSYDYTHPADLFSSIFLKNPNNKFGLIKGNKIQKQFESIFKEKIKDCNIPINIVTSNMTKKQCEIFNEKDNGEENLSEIVRMSMSYPGIFELYEKDGCKYADGGIFHNFPIDIYKDDKDTLTFGIRIIAPKRVNEIADLQEYLSLLTDILIVKSEEEDIEDVTNKDNVRIFNIVSSESNMDLKKLNKQFVNKLLEYGEECINILLKGKA